MPCLNELDLKLMNHRNLLIINVKKLQKLTQDEFTNFDQGRSSFVRTPLNAV